MAAVKKSDAAPAEAAQGADGAAAPAAEAAPAEVVEAPAPEAPEPPTAPARLVFNGPIDAVVAGVGAVESGAVVEVPEELAAVLCVGEPPLFVRAPDA